jgi:hypothetical protein
MLCGHLVLPGHTRSILASDAAIMAYNIADEMLKARDA